MFSRRSVLQGSCAAALAGPSSIRAWAAPLDIAPPGLIFVTLVLDGHTVRALVDTGSIRALQISQPVATALALQLEDTGAQTQRYQAGGRKILSGRIRTATLDGVKFTDLSASVAPGDIETIGSQTGQSFGAIVGWPLLSRQPFTIDYRARKFELKESDSSSGLLLPLMPGKPLPVVGGTLGERAETFLVDTGAPLNSIDPTIAGGAAAGNRVELSFSVGGQKLTETFRVKDLSAMTKGLGARAVLGHRFLQKYLFAWKPDAKAIRLS